MNNFKENIYQPIIDEAKYWQDCDYSDHSDEYRQTHDMDCVLTGGSLNADMLFSLWLPLRYALNFYGTAKWQAWKDYECKALRPKKLNLKKCPAFLSDLIENIELYLPPEGELTALISKLFFLGRTRCNVILLYDRKWNSQRGDKPFWDYMPHFLHELDYDEKVISWIKREKLEGFFSGKINKENIMDLAGTGDVCRHAPEEIDLPMLLKNYIAILEKRQSLMGAAS